MRYGIPENVTQKDQGNVPEWFGQAKFMPPKDQRGKKCKAFVLVSRHGTLTPIMYTHLVFQLYLGYYLHTLNSSVSKVWYTLVIGYEV